MANAVVINNCDSNIFLWSAGGFIGPRQTIAPGDAYSEAIHRDSVSGGVAFKITETKNGIWEGSSQMIFAYSLTGNRVWYDLSAVFGSPFEGDAVCVVPENDKCPFICWPNGTNPGGSSVKACEEGCDIVMTACARGC